MQTWDLKKEIVEKFRTQADFAQAVKMYESKVSQVLNGRRFLTESESAKWQEVLECEAKLLSPVTK